MSTIPQVNRLGVRPQFPKVKSYLKQYQLGPIGALEGRTWEKDEMPRLLRYIDEGPFPFRYAPEFDERPYAFGNAQGDLSYVSNVHRWYAIQAALSDGNEWQVPWKQSTAYKYWSTRMEFRTQARILSDYQTGKRPQYLGVLALHRVGASIGNCLALGWTDWAIDLSQRSRWALDHGGFNEGDDSYHRRIQHFVLRLVGNWQGWSERGGPSCAFDEPLYNLLVEHWRTPDPADLESLFLAACDRHTHQARVDSNKAKFDLPWMDTWYAPFEILSVLRLRQMQGLQNPELDHLLMQTPLGCLPEPSPPYTDDLLEGVLARARAEFPDL